METPAQENPKVSTFYYYDVLLISPSKSISVQSCFYGILCFIWKILWCIVTVCIIHRSTVCFSLFFFFQSQLSKQAFWLPGLSLSHPLLPSFFSPSNPPRSVLSINCLAFTVCGQTPCFHEVLCSPETAPVAWDVLPLSGEGVLWRVLVVVVELGVIEVREKRQGRIQCKK